MTKPQRAQPIDPTKLRALLAAGTARPWRVRLADRDSDRVMGVYGPERYEDYGYGPVRDDQRTVETDGGYYEPKKPDADLIVSSVNALEALLDVYDAAVRWQRSGSHPCATPGDGCMDCVLWEAIDRARGGR